MLRDDLKACSHCESQQSAHVRIAVNGRRFSAVASRAVPMRVLLSTIGSRSDVQPMVALALQFEGAWPGSPYLRAA